jgi:hypothetical protein
MKFFEVSVGQKFRFNNQEYIKIPEIKVSCCKVQHNAELTGSAEKVVLKPMDEVEVVQ